MTQHSPFQQTVASFLQELEGGNKSTLTLTAYKTDLLQFFHWLSENDVAETIHMPNKERKRKVVLRTDEYSRMLSEAGGNPRDFAILQLFLQTGIRVSELIAITFLVTTQSSWFAHFYGGSEECSQRLE